MPRSNEETKQNQKSCDDEVYKRMLEISFDQPLTERIIFEDEEDLDGLLQEDTSDINNAGQSPGTNNLIILGKKKSDQKNDDKHTDEAQIKQATDNKSSEFQYNLKDLHDIIDKRLIEIRETTVENEPRFGSNEIRSVFWENSEGIDKLPSRHTDFETCRSKISLELNDNSCHKKLQEIQESGINALPQTTETKVQDNNLQESLQENTQPTNLLNLLGKEIISESKSLHKESLDISRQQDIVSAQIDEIKQKYKAFPRRKVTSRREIKKYPGKMDAMNKINSTNISQRSSNEYFNKNVHDQNTLNERLNGFHSNLSLNSCSLVPEPDINVGAPTSATEDISRNSNKQHEIFNLYALKTVAGNILFVFPFLNYYLVVKKSQSQSTEHLLQAERNFVKAKIQSFGLSYSTVLSLIIPNKGNDKFMQTFYEIGREIALEKKVQNFNQTNWEILCLEMIKWTEKKKQELENFNTEIYFKPRHSSQPGPDNAPLAENFQQSKLLPPTKNVACYNLENGNAPANYTNPRPPSLLFTAGPPGREIQINYNPDSNFSQSSHTVRNNTNSVSAPNNYVQNRNQVSFPVKASHMTEQPLSNPPPWSFQYFPQTQNAAAPLPSTNQKHKTCLPTSSYPQASDAFCSSKPPPPYPQARSGPQPHIQKDVDPISTVKPNGTQKKKKKKPHILQQNNQLEDNHLRSSVTQERSSVSRDSGFMSPVRDNNSVEQMESYVNDYFTPMITHVTSTSPNATYSPYSRCQVCGTLTNLKCIGCNNYYYCGPRCQGIDWETHKNFCHK